MSAGDDTFDEPTGVRGDKRAAGRLARARAIAFRASRRHSIMVRLLRMALPVCVVALMVGYGVVAASKVGIRVGRGDLKLQDIQITSEDLKMKGVSYAGATKDGGRYDVRARDAQVDLQQKGPVQLNFIEGDLTQNTGVVTKLNARRGILDNQKGEMDLFDGVEVDGTQGLRVRMKSAKIFNKENRIITNEGVTADMPTGRIVARTMDMYSKERRGTFTGDVAVRLTQDPSAQKAALGTGKDARAPIDVRAQQLDVDDNAKFAHFTGGVAANQGESVLSSSTLRVTYEGTAALPGQPKPAVPAGAAPGALVGPASRVSKILATGQVQIVSGADRRVSSETAEFDVAADTALFIGPRVEVQQAKNRLLGRRLWVDRKNGKSRLDSPAEGRTPAGRIQTTFYQANDPTKAGAKPKAATPAASDAVPGLANFKTDPNAPMDIEAESLDVNDPAKQAIFRTKVRAQQGDFVIQAEEVVANYTGETGLMSAVDGAPAPAAAAPPGTPKAPGAQISKIDAKTNVIITSKDGQEARGQWATYDAKANTVVLGGAGVMLKQGRNEATGARVNINMLTGEARLENEPGATALAPALAPMTAPKSAPGPGGLPAVNVKTPAPVAPAANAPCPPGRQCLTTFIEDVKEQQKQKKGAPVPKAAQPAKAPTEGWQPSSSPSPVYRQQ